MRLRSAPSNLASGRLWERPAARADHVLFNVRVASLSVAFESFESQGRRMTASCGGFLDLRAVLSQV